MSLLRKLLEVIEKDVVLSKTSAEEVDETHVRKFLELLDKEANKKPMSPLN